MLSDLQKTYLQRYKANRFNKSKTALECGFDRSMFYQDADFMHAAEKARYELIEDVVDVLVSKSLAGESWAVKLFLEANAKKDGYGQTVNMNLAGAVGTVELRAPKEAVAAYTAAWFAAEENIEKAQA